jgi:hypothetical protein
VATNCANYGNRQAACIGDPNRNCIWNSVGNTCGDRTLTECQHNSQPGLCDADAGRQCMWSTSTRSCSVRPVLDPCSENTLSEECSAESTKGCRWSLYRDMCFTSRATACTEHPNSIACQEDQNLKCVWVTGTGDATGRCEAPPPPVDPDSSFSVRRSLFMIIFIAVVTIF